MAKDYSLDIIKAVKEWKGIAIEPHRFGGREFKMGRVEIGHIHMGGMLDIPYTVQLRKQLVSENHTGEHHLLPDTGWTTYHVRSRKEVKQGLWLLRVSYLQKKATRARGKENELTMLQDLADDLKLSDPLHRIIFSGKIARS